MKRITAIVATAVLGVAFAAASALAAPASPFTGAWYGFDPAPPAGDGSALYLLISGGSNPTITFVDRHGSICVRTEAPTTFFASKLAGHVEGNHLHGAYLWARCGSTSFDTSGWPAGYDYDPATDTLSDGWATFHRR